MSIRSNDEATNSLATYFAPPERALPDDLAADIEMLHRDVVATQILDSFPEPAMILNRQRQIVYANDKLAHLLKVNRKTLLGSRFGEAVKCIHAHDCSGGCGTSLSCRDCGAVRSVQQSWNNGVPSIQECRIAQTTENGLAALDLRVWATPFVRSGRFTIFAVRDVTDEKRRVVLEELLFHDILKSLGGLQQFAKLFPDLDLAAANEVLHSAGDAVGELMELIKSQRDLAAAERGDLVPNFNNFDGGGLLLRLRAKFGPGAIAIGKSVTAPSISGNSTICSDETLLSRVLSVLIKNALEASQPGQAIELSFYREGEIATFAVHNQGFMAERVQRQVFLRSFSTKATDGRGRGLGTYSAKLLTEKYLGGTIAFSSTPERGTTFVVRLPPSPPLFAVPRHIQEQREDNHRD